MLNLKYKHTVDLNYISALKTLYTCIYEIEFKSFQNLFCNSNNDDYNYNNNVILSNNFQTQTNNQNFKVFNNFTNIEETD